MPQRPQRAALALLAPVALVALTFVAACGGDDAPASSPATSAAQPTAAAQPSPTVTPKPPEATATPVASPTPLPPVTAEKLVADLAALYASVAVPPTLCSLDAMKAQWAKFAPARQLPTANEIDPAVGSAYPWPAWLELLGSYAQEVSKISTATQNAQAVAYLSAVRRFAQQEVAAAVAVSKINVGGRPIAGAVMAPWEQKWLDKSTFAKPNECDLKGG